VVLLAFGGICKLPRWLGRSSGFDRSNSERMVSSCLSQACFSIIGTVLKKITPLAGFLAKCALVCSAALLLSNLPFTSTRAHNAWLSSLPLALGGIAYAVLQIRLRPDRVVLVKRLILAASFICWAIDQVLPAGPMATFIGDAVVSAYVLDLFWIIQDQSETSLGSTPCGCVAAVDQDAARRIAEVLIEWKESEMIRMGKRPAGTGCPIE
jgi:hypothetical protein